MAQKIRILIINDNTESIASIKSSIEGFSEFKIIGEGMNGHQAVEMAFSYQPDIVIMDIHMPIQDGFTACMKIMESAPYIGVILIGSAESAEILRKAMQAGAGDFLELPLSQARLHQAIMTLYHIKQNQKKQLVKNPLIIPQRHPKVVTVFSSKGGVGKTVLATNVAVALKTQTRSDVLLIDLDLQFGDVVDLLNVDMKASIIDLLEDIDKIENNEFNKYLCNHYTGIKILPAPNQPEDADRVSEENAKEIISLFLNSFDYIVIDLPPLFNGVTIGCIDMSDQILLVSTMEIPTLKNIRSGLEILRKLGCPDNKITVVLNRFQQHREIQLEDIKKFLGKEEIACINDNSEIVSTAINMGTPFVLSYKEEEISRQVEQIASSLIDYKRMGAEYTKKSPLLHRIFGKKG